jgi:phosphoserine aminotransferase
VNIPFFQVRSGDARNDEMDGEVLRFCEKRGLVNLKRFATVGGYKASISNAVPMEG